MEPRARQVIVQGDLKQALGYLGAVTLFIGLFLPLFEIPEVGRVNYFWNGCGAGVALVLVALGSVVALVSRQLWALWLTGVSSLVLIGLTLVRVVIEVGLTAMQLSWGWPVLFIGGALLVAAAEVGRRDGVSMPRALGDIVVATALLLALIVVGPPVLSGTQKAVTDFQVTKKLEERGRWVPHESARAEMAAVKAQVLEQVEAPVGPTEEERRAAELERRRRSEARQAAQIRLVADIRRWYPGFAEALRPVLGTRQAFLQEYERGGLDAAQPACAEVAQQVAIARERLPHGPDAALDAKASGLLDLYLASAQACRDEAGVSVALSELERAEERVGAHFQGLADSLAAYCLRVPSVRGGDPESPASVLACDPRDRKATDPAQPDRGSPNPA